MPTEVRPGIAVAMVTGHLHARDNKYQLRVSSGIVSFGYLDQA